MDDQIQVSPGGLIEDMRIKSAVAALHVEERVKPVDTPERRAMSSSRSYQNSNASQQRAEFCHFSEISRFQFCTSDEHKHLEEFNAGCRKLRYHKNTGS